jgi:type I restriction enzyme S subunit
VSAWQEYTLDSAPLEILDGDRGKNYPSHDEFYDDGYCLFLSTKNVKVDGFDFSECQFISKEKDNLLRKGKLSRNDVVLTTRGTVGNVAFFDNSINFVNVRINSGMVIIRPDTERLYPAFNHYIFRNLQTDFHTFSSGSAQPQLPIRDLKQMTVQIPSLPEQKAVAMVLSSLDDKIDLLHCQNATLEAMAKTLFRQWFVEEAQEDWESGKLGDFVTISYGKNLPTNQLIESGYPVFGGNSQIGFFDKYLYELPQVLVSCRGEASGKVNISLPFSFVTNNSLALVRNKRSEITFEFLKYHALNYDFALHVSGSAQPQITIDGLYDAEFTLPPQGFISKFSSIVTKWEEKKLNNFHQIQTLEKLRDNLLPKLMSGEVKVCYD